MKANGTGQHSHRGQIESSSSSRSLTLGIVGESSSSSIRGDSPSSKGKKGLELSYRISTDQFSNGHQRSKRIGSDRIECKKEYRVV
jgi:hypothetical protein